MGSEMCIRDRFWFSFCVAFRFVSRFDLRSCFVSCICFVFMFRFALCGVVSFCLVSLRFVLCRSVLCVVVSFCVVFRFVFRFVLCLVSFVSRFVLCRVGFDRAGLEGKATGEQREDPVQDQPGVPSLPLQRHDGLPHQLQPALLAHVHDQGPGRSGESITDNNCGTKH